MATLMLLKNNMSFCHRPPTNEFSGKLGVITLAQAKEPDLNNPPQTVFQKLRELSVGPRASLSLRCLTNHQEERSERIAVLGVWRRQ